MPNALPFPERSTPEDRVQVVGIVNVTPDSFSDGGMAFDCDRAVALGERLVAEGADWLDIGGESTRPGASPVDLREELKRVLPVIRELAQRVTVPISVDTHKAAVADAALAEGASIVNDISGGRLDSAMLQVVAKHNAQVVLGHLRGTPSTMQDEVSFLDVVAEVATELDEQVRAARGLGITEIVVDPGLGFGKHLQENVALLCAGDRLRAVTGCPVMVGASRKKFIGEISGVEKPSDRLGGSVAAALMAVAHGASLVRVHDVAMTVQALAVYERIRQARTHVRGDGGG